MNIVRVRLLIMDACIIQIQAASVFQCAARKTSVLILVLRRKQSNLLMFPVHQILAHRVPPMHSPPLGRPWKILIKQMVLSPVINKAIGIIDPVTRRL